MLESLLSTGKKGPSSLGYAFIAGGYISVSATNRYTYSTKAVVAGISLSVGRHTSSGASNSSVGIIAGGESSTVVDKYTLASGALSAGTALNNGRGYMGGTGMETVAIFSGGQGFGTTNTKYTYAGDVVATGTAFAVSRLGLSATTNPTYGIFAGGSPNVNRVDKYTYSDDTIAGGTALTFGREGMAGFGLPVRGYFMAGKQNANYSAYSEAYTYASNTTAARGSLLTALAYLTGCGNDTEAYVAGGANAGGTAQAGGYTFTYATDTSVASTSLRETHQNVSSFSSVNGMIG